MPARDRRAQGTSRVVVVASAVVAASLRSSSPPPPRRMRAAVGVGGVVGLSPAVASAARAPGRVHPVGVRTSGSPPLNLHDEHRNRSDASDDRPCRARESRMLGEALFCGEVRRRRASRGDPRRGGWKSDDRPPHTDIARVRHNNTTQRREEDGKTEGVGRREEDTSSPRGFNRHEAVEGVGSGN